MDSKHIWIPWWWYFGSMSTNRPHSEVLDYLFHDFLLCLPFIFMAQYVLAVMFHKLIITYINRFHRKHQYFISVLILIGYYILSLLYSIILTPITMQKLSLEYTSLQKFNMQSGYVIYQLQKARQTQCELYYGFLNIVGFIVIKIATSIWYNKKTSWTKFSINPIYLKDRENI